MQNLDNILCYVAYATGFAIGNFIGIRLEAKLALGKLVLRIITRKDAHDLIATLRRKGFGVTSLDAEGKSGPVQIIFMVLNRADLHMAIGTIHQFNPQAFYSVEDIRLVRAGIFRRKKGILYTKLLWPLRLYKKWRAYRRLRTVRKGK
jgi:uncharacterized protein YebE (UPF0316 family)